MFRVFVGCEFSGVVRRAFRDRGHLAYSCDLLPPEDGSPYHFRRDVFDGIDAARHTFELDLLIAHPPCTHLCVSGARWFFRKRVEQADAIEFVRRLLASPVDRICIENPIGVLSSHIRKPEQIVQPWMWGDYETKATCFWLKNLPVLVPTYRTAEECREALRLPVGVKPTPRVHYMPPGPKRASERSRTPVGIASAMAAQWA